MSDYSDGKEYLSRLKSHLEVARYAAVTVSRCMNAARHFLADLKKQHVEVTAACPLHVELYLKHQLRRYRQRHGHLPSYKSWRCLQNDGIRMLLRLVQGQWPPIPVPVTDAEILRQKTCQAYAGWITSFCGRSPGTVSNRSAEAGRLLDWLGEGVTRETLATLTLNDIDAYMKDRAHCCADRRYTESRATCEGSCGGCI